MVSKLWGAALILMMMASLSLAHEYKAGDLQIDHPWTKPTAPGAKVAGGYMKIENKGKEADRLISVTFSGSETSEIHEMAMKEGVMSMNQLKDGLEIQPGQTVELKSGSYHLMFITLKQPLKDGDKIKGTLTFEKAGMIEVVFNVEKGQKKKGGAKEESHDHHKGHGAEHKH